MSKKKKRIYYIDYYSAVHWFNAGLVLFNQIKEFDPDFKAPGEDKKKEYFQFFLTSYTDRDVKYMHQFFPEVVVQYSEKLELWVLCVDNFGTPWDEVMTICHLNWVESNDTKWKEGEIYDKYDSPVGRVFTAHFQRSKEK